MREGEILVIHGDIGIGKTTHMLFFVENILKEGNKEVIFLDSTRIESSLGEIEQDIGEFIVVDALGRGGSVKKKSEQLIDFVKSNKAKLIITMRTREKDIFEDVVREKGYEIKTVEPKPPLDAVSYIVAKYLVYFDVNTDDLNAKEVYEIIFSDDYVYYPELKEALEMIAEKSNGCPFYIYHTISELKRKGLQFDLATVKDLPEGVEELLINTLRNEFVFKGEGREGNRSFLKLLICLSKIEKDFSVYLYESLYEELKDEFDIRDRVEAFKSFLSEGESIYELMLPSYWKDAIQKALKRDTKDKWLADEFIRAEAELEPEIIETVLKREIEKGAINRRYFHLIADAAKTGLLDYAYEKYKKTGKIENEEKDYAKFVILGEFRLKGVTSFSLRQFEKAVRNFDKEVELSPEDATAYVDRGIAYFGLGHYEAAIKDHTTAIKLNPVHVAAYTSRGNAYARLEQYEAAIREYTTAIELSPEYATAYVDRGITYSELGHYEAAIKDHTTAIELSPENAYAYQFRGDAYARLEQYEEAIQDYTTAIELSPEDADAYTSRGDTYDDLEHYEEAIHDYSKAIELNPKDKFAYRLRGVVYNRLGLHEEAIRDLDKAIELNPEYAAAYRYRGNAYDGLEQYEEAISDYTKSIKLSPKNARAYLSRGIVYAKLEQYEEALKDLDKAIELNPENADAYRYRGNAYVDLEQYEEAICDYTKAIELNPENAIVYRLRSLAYAELGDNGAARQDLDMVIELNRDTEV